NLTHNHKTSPSEWNKSYVEKIESHINDIKHQDEIPEAIFKIPNAFKQFQVFMKRDVLSKLTNTQYLLINFIEAPLLAFILAYLVRYFNTDADTTKGYLYRENENVPAYMFMSVVVALFIGLTVSAEEIIRDRKIRKRESFLNLSKGSYLWSKIIIMFVLSAIQTLTFVIVGNAVLGVKGMYLDYWMVLFTTSCFANMLGLNISASFNSAVTIYIMIPFLIIPQLLLSGVIVKFDKLNPTLAMQGGVPIAGEVMTSRWAYEALAVNQFKDNAFEKQFYTFDKAIAESEYKKVYWKEKIEAKISKVEREIATPGKKEDLKADIALIKNEIEKENIRLPKDYYDFKDISKLNADKVDLNVLGALKVWLNEPGTNSFKLFYINKDKHAREKKNAIIQKLTSGGPEKLVAFNKLQEANENEALNQMMVNSNDFGDKGLEKDR